jgi:hypothetical protein
MSRDLNILSSPFKEVVTGVLATCNNSGAVMRPFFTQRDPWEQARLWRRSRSSKEIKQAIYYLKNQGAEWLAHILESVGPQHGKWATNALPGESWHNWGLAVDCFLLVDGKAVWDADHEGYRIYAEIAKKHDLVPGYYWTSRDAVHVQYYLHSVKSCYTWSQIDDKMQEMYGDETNV